jgi:hypothetical protein
MQKNIGVADQYLRLVSGLVALASAAQCRRNSLTQALLTAYGATKVAEGVTGWCPLMYALGIRTTSETRPHPANTQHGAEHRLKLADRGEYRAPHRELSDSRDGDFPNADNADSRISRETQQIGTAYQ